MISNLKIAHSVLALVFSLQKDLNQSLFDLQGRMEKSKWCSYRLAVAYVLSELFENFTDSLISLHKEFELHQNKEYLEELMDEHDWPMDNVLQRLLKGKGNISHSSQSLMQSPSDERFFGISEADTADAIEALMFFLRRALFQSQSYLSGIICNKEWACYRKAVSRVVNEINLHISMPLYVLFPEVKDRVKTSYYSELLVSYKWPKDNLLQRVLEKSNDSKLKR